MLVSVDAQATFTALRMMDACLCVCVFSVCWFLTSLSSVGLYILTLFHWVPHNIQDNTSHIAWMVTGSMTLSWNFPVTRLMKDRSKTHDKEKADWSVGQGRDKEGLRHVNEPVMPQAQLCWAGGCFFPTRSIWILPFDIWKFYLMHSVLRSHFWGLPDILMCATH